MALLHSEIFLKASDAAALHDLLRQDESANAVACSSVPLVLVGPPRSASFLLHLQWIELSNRPVCVSSAPTNACCANQVIVSFN